METSEQASEGELVKYLKVLRDPLMKRKTDNVLIYIPVKKDKEQPLDLFLLSSPPPRVFTLWKVT